MINFDDVTKENIKEHSPNWPQILIKFIYMLKIHLKQNINFQLTNEKV